MCSDIAGTLTGAPVLDVPSTVAGPHCCQMLGDLRADLLRNEPSVHGDGLRGHAQAKNGTGLWWKEVARNRRTIALDIGPAEGATVLRRVAVDRRHDWRQGLTSRNAGTDATERIAQRVLGMDLTDVGKLAAPTATLTHRGTRPRRPAQGGAG